MDPDVLGKLVYFQHIDHRDLKTIASLVRELPADRGDVLFIEGEPSKGLYFLVKGSVKVSRISPEGREQVLTVIGPYQTCNDVPAFDGGPCPATAMALEPSVVGLIPTDVMRRLVREHPAVAEGMLRVFASRLRALTTLVADLTHLDVVGRVAKVLLTYQAASGRRSLSLGQQDLASIVGTTREVVSRALRNLEEREAIVRRGSSVEIISTEKLAAVLEEATR